MRNPISAYILSLTSLGVILLLCTMSCFGNLSDGETIPTTSQNMMGGKESIRLPTSFFRIELDDLGKSFRPNFLDSSSYSIVKSNLVYLTQEDDNPDLFADTTQFYSLIMITDLERMELNPTIGGIFYGRMQKNLDLAYAADPNTDIKKVSTIFTPSGDKSMLKYKHAIIDRVNRDRLIVYRGIYLYTNASNSYGVFELTLGKDRDIEKYLWTLD